MSRNFCTGCGKTMSPHANFCTVCGKKTSSGERQFSDESKNICRNCGMPHSATASFCIGCGFNFQNRESPLTERDICDFCGIQISPTAVFCTGCGNKLQRNENIITDKSKAAAEKVISPITGSAEAISDTGHDDQISDIYIKETAAVYTPQTIRSKHARRFPILPVIILLAIPVFFVSVLTAYLNGWLKNPFNTQTPYDPEASVYGSDKGSWENSPDLKKEQEAIAKRQREMISNLEKNNIEKAVKYFFPEIQSAWQKQMEDDPEGTATLAAVLSTAEMTFLGEENALKENPRSRTATFLVKYEQSGFYITWIKYDGTWYLYDF